MDIGRWVVNQVGPARALKAMSLYPPYVGAGIRVREVSDDFSRVEVEMALRPWNRNAVGTQFGGSLYSMVDPFLMLMLMVRLGPQYVVWDKEATIRFLKPGRGTVHATFELTDARATELKAEVDAAGKIEPRFTVEIRGDDGEVVAEVSKLLHVHRKRSSP